MLGRLPVGEQHLLDVLLTHRAGAEDVAAFDLVGFDQAEPPRGSDGQRHRFLRRRRDPELEEDRSPRVADLVA
jgi:hypothetical protein